MKTTKKSLPRSAPQQQPADHAARGARPGLRARRLRPHVFDDRIAAATNREFAAAMAVMECLWSTMPTDERFQSELLRILDILQGDFQLKGPQYWPIKLFRMQDVRLPRRNRLHFRLAVVRHFREAIVDLQQGKRSAYLPR